MERERERESQVFKEKHMGIASHMFRRCIKKWLRVDEAQTFQNDPFCQGPFWIFLTQSTTELSAQVVYVYILYNILCVCVCIIELYNDIIYVHSKYISEGLFFFFHPTLE